MASHAHPNLDNDRTQLPAAVKTIGIAVMAAGLIALALAVVLTFALPHDDHHAAADHGHTHADGTPHKEGESEAEHAAHAHADGTVHKETETPEEHAKHLHADGTVHKEGETAEEHAAHGGHGGHGGDHGEGHHAGPYDHKTPVRRFFFSYLFGLAPFLAVSCAALIFVLIHHLVRAGWVANARRVMETFAVQLPLLSLLLIPVIGTVIWQKGTIYSWAKPTDTKVVHHGGGGGGGHDDSHAGETAEEHAKHAGTAADGKASDGDAHSQDAHAKPGVASVSPEGSPSSDRNATQSPMSQGVFPRGPLPEQEYPNEQVRPGVARDFDAIIAEKNGFWLNPIVWSIRIPLYLLIVSGIAVYFHRSSVKQDLSGDVDISSRLMTLSAPLLMAAGLVVTFIAFDVFMSLDPHWFSTMYGVYFFASGSQAMWAATALALLILQSRGYLKESINTDHFHDIGKWMWAFIFFFAYIAFSQYMLQWYANMPEETFWYDKRGYSTQRPNGYSILVLVLLFGRLVIPFAGLLSRHVKRSRFGIGFWACWLIAMLFVDMYLLVMPEYAWVERYHLPPIGIIEILCVLGVAGLWVGNVVRMLATYALRPVRDPRVHESLAIVNI